MKRKSFVFLKLFGPIKIPNHDCLPFQKSNLIVVTSENITGTVVKPSDPGANI